MYTTADSTTSIYRHTSAESFRVQNLLPNTITVLSKLGSHLASKGSTYLVSEDISIMASRSNLDNSKHEEKFKATVLNDISNRLYEIRQAIDVTNSCISDLKELPNGVKQTYNKSLSTLVNALSSVHIDAAAIIDTVTINNPSCVSAGTESLGAVLSNSDRNHISSEYKKRQEETNEDGTNRSTDNNTEHAHSDVSAYYETHDPGQMGTTREYASDDEQSIAVSGKLPAHVSTTFHLPDEPPVVKQQSNESLNSSDAADARQRELEEQFKNDLTPSQLKLPSPQRVRK